MNRRKFIQSLAAVFTLPAAPSLSLSSATAAVPAAAAVPAQARFWAIYMSALHGECTPQTLQNLLHIPEVDSKRYIGQLLADGVIKPNPLLQNTVSELVKPTDENVVEKVKNRFKKKSEAAPQQQQIPEAVETVEVQTETEAANDLNEEDDEINQVDLEQETEVSEEPVPTLEQVELAEDEPTPTPTQS